MKKNKIPKLHIGDTVGLICPAFKYDPTKQNAIKMEEELKKLGFKVKYGKNCQKINGYFAGTDFERVEDIHEMFLDKDVKMIMCIKGGYGASRIVDKIDYDIIRNNPKMFIGFSDITVLLNAFYQRASLITIHGLVGIFLGHSRIDQVSMDDFKTLLFTPQKKRIIRCQTATTLVSGECEGELVGGNLSLIRTLIGTDYDIDVKGKILFIEDVEEEPYRIDGMLSQLRLSKKLSEVKGIILGYFTDCTTDTENVQSYRDILLDYFKDSQVPVLMDFCSGHDFPFINLPIGARVRMNADKKEITILEEIYK